jgi:hypothetical protein
MSKKQSIPDAQRELLERVHTEGVQAAYEASLAICRDEKAPAPARATASATIFRVGGYFDRDRAKPAEKQPHEMTPEELTDGIEALRRGLSRTSGPDGEPDDDEGIFG